MTPMKLYLPLLHDPSKNWKRFSKVNNSYGFKHRTLLLRYSGQLSGLKSELQDVTGRLR
jgi:hypothetical protein